MCCSSPKWLNYDFMFAVFVLLNIGGWGVKPTGKLFRFVSCVRAVCLSSEIGVKRYFDLFLFCFFVCVCLLPFQVFPFPSAGCYFVRSFVLLFVRSFVRSFVRYLFEELNEISVI